MPKFVVLIGEPASGKTTIFKDLLKKLNLNKNFESGLLRGHFNSDSKIAVFGIYDSGTFQGTDRLSMAVSPDAIRFLDSQFCQNLNTVYLEGDRLGSEKFLSEVLKRYSLTVYKTIVSEEILKRRHEFRGDTQSESWLKGRASKVKKVSETFQAKPLFNQNPEELSNAIEILFLERV